MMLFGLGPIAAALLIARFVPSPAPSIAREPLGRRLRGLFANGPLWLLGLTSMCAIANQFILATWAPLLFQEAGVADVGRAGIYAALQGIAASVGMIVGGWAHDRLARRGFEAKTVIVAGLSALALSMLAMAAVIAHRSVPVLAVLVFLAALYSLLGRMWRVEDLGASFGLSNSISFIGAIVGPIATGWARDLSGSFSAGCLLAAYLAVVGVALVSGVRAPREPVLAPAERRGSARPEPV